MGNVIRFVFRGIASGALGTLGCYIMKRGIKVATNPVKKASIKQKAKNIKNEILR